MTLGALNRVEPSKNQFLSKLKVNGAKRLILHLKSLTRFISIHFNLGGHKNFARLIGNNYFLV